nr:uncharacterized protein LOC115258488 [Aedes albopictus]
MKKRASRSVVAKSAKLKPLLRQRANILGSAALIKKFNDQYQQGQFHQVKVRIDTLDRLWADFAHIQDEIEEIEDGVTGDDTDDEEEPTISAQRVQFQIMYHELKASLVMLVETLSKRLDPATLKEWENSCQENVRPTYQQLTEFVRKTSRVLQSVKLLQTPNHPVEPKPSKPKSISTHVATEVTNKCPLCKDAHPLFKCDQFVGMEVKQRFEMVKKNGLCINCLKGSHLAKNCSSGSCRNCSKKHHTLLHLPPLAVAAKPSSSQTTLACSTAASEVIPPAPPQVSSNSSVVASHSFSSPPSRSQQPPVGAMSSGPVNSFSYSVVVAPSSSPVDSSASQSIGKSLELNSSPVASCVAPQSVPVRAPSDEVFLSTVAVKVKDSNGNPRYVRGVLDSCSQANFISEALARKLELKRDRISIDVSGIGQGIVHIRSKVLIRISSRFGGLDYPLECLVIPQITVTLPNPRFNISSGVDILVGGELFYSLMLSHTINLRAGLPILQKTVFGYVVAGRLSTASRTSPIRVVSATTSLDNKLQRFWEVENFDGYKAMTPLEEACEGHFRSTVSRTRCQLLDQVRSTTRFTGVVTFWSDSSIVLHWIRSPPTVWKVFVSNRIAEIQKLSIHDSWRHVPSKANPADRISRGVLPSDILEDSLWWHGPNFLVQAVETWPEDIVSLTREEQEVRDVEARQVVTFAVTHVDHSIIHRYSDLGRLLRVVSYCFRFCRNALSPQNRRKVGPLQPPEVDYSLKSLIRSVQSTEFPEEIRCLSANPQRRLTSKDRKLQSSFKSLNPFLDNTGLLRIGERLAKLAHAYLSRHGKKIPYIYFSSVRTHPRAVIDPFYSAVRRSKPS